MCDTENTGNVEEKYEEKKIGWKIADFFSFSEKKTEIRSSDFSFANGLWHLRLLPNSTSKPGFMYWCLVNTKSPRCSVEYSYGLKKQDRNVEYLSKGILQENDEYSALYYIELSEIQQRKSELVPANVFNITCTLKRITIDSDQPKVLENPNLEKLISK